MNISQLIQKTEAVIEELRATLPSDIQSEAKQLLESDSCQVLSQSPVAFTFLCQNRPVEILIHSALEDDERLDADVVAGISPGYGQWDAPAFACLQSMQLVLQMEPSKYFEHKRYTREGMIHRVLDERLQKTLHANYRIHWADNIFGDHTLINENGVKYKIFLRDFKNETGYSNSKDSEVNKLGTTKHIMYAFHALKQSASLQNRLKKQCPFVEIYCDALNEYRVSWFYPNSPDEGLLNLLNRYFNQERFVPDDQLHRLPGFLEEAALYTGITVRPEVVQKVNDYLENLALLTIQKNFQPEFGSIKASLYDYQKEGITFAACRKHAVIADEMGLGKTIQAIGTAVIKKELFGFSKTLVVCPASLKEQWKKEIEKFTSERAEVVSGTPDERELQYRESDAFFLIINYETVLRDQEALNRARFDFLILDEAQKVKNYATKSASAIKNVGRKHVLIITGTPIENKLIDLFSLMSILDPHLLGPLWEFSYRHCLFDHQKPNKINAYYNLSQLKEELKTVLLRREKRKVIEQLPNVQQQDVPVGMTPLQAYYHASYASGIGQIINKKFLTTFDLQRLQQLLTGMRMVCDSTYLIDEATNDSPKLEELRYILLEKLDLKNSGRKVIIFSEWVKMHHLIGQLLLQNNIGFSELNGSIPVKKRGELIRQFEEDPHCQVFLSTEAGGSGLNLQVADILINFELPWNPAKKNQRIGRIDRLGQKSEKLTIFNFITTESIEERIATGLLVKQNLFDSVLNEGSTSDWVDFTEKGRGQFLQQMKELAGTFESVPEELEQDEATDTKESREELNVEKPVATADRQYKIPFDSEEEDEAFSEEPELKTTASETITEQQVAEPSHVLQMEQVLNNGMQFLSGLMQMATGKSMGMENQKIEVNQKTGEVTLKFKLPGF